MVVLVFIFVFPFPFNEFSINSSFPPSLPPSLPPGTTPSKKTSHTSASVNTNASPKPVVGVLVSSTARETLCFIQAAPIILSDT